MCKENKFKKISEGYCPCCGVSDVYNREGERLGVVINLKGEEECPVD